MCVYWCAVFRVCVCVCVCVYWCAVFGVCSGDSDLNHQVNTVYVLLSFLVYVVLFAIGLYRCYRS